jgi:hypothetical protein
LAINAWIGDSDAYSTSRIDDVAIFDDVECDSDRLVGGQTKTLKRSVREPAGRTGLSVHQPVHGGRAAGVATVNGGSGCNAHHRSARDVWLTAGADDTDRRFGMTWDRTP